MTSMRLTASFGPGPRTCRFARHGFDSTTLLGRLRSQRSHESSGLGIPSQDPRLEDLHRLGRSRLALLPVDSDSCHSIGPPKGRAWRTSSEVTVRWQVAQRREQDLSRRSARVTVFLVGYGSFRSLQSISTKLHELGFRVKAAISDKVGRPLELPVPHSVSIFRPVKGPNLASQIRGVELSAAREGGRGLPA